MGSETGRAERRRASEGGGRGRGGGGGGEPVHLFQVSLLYERVNRRSARTNKLYLNSPTDLFRPCLPRRDCDVWIVLQKFVSLQRGAAPAGTELRCRGDYQSGTGSARRLVGGRA